jgi:hypothetical protein
MQSVAQHFSQKVALPLDFKIAQGAGYRNTSDLKGPGHLPAGQTAILVKKSSMIFFYADFLIANNMVTF